MWGDWRSDSQRQGSSGPQVRVNHMEAGILLSHVSSRKDLLWEQNQAWRLDSQECVDNDVTT